jgi:hypothetical protein
VVAVDPVSVLWSQQLKPYTAEAAMALLAFLAADAAVRHARTADVVVLALVLALGTTCSNAQLPVAPPILAALAARALLRGDGAALPFLGSRFKPGDEALLRARLATKGRVVREEHRERALLLLLETE